MVGCSEDPESPRLSPCTPVTGAVQISTGGYGFVVEGCSWSPDGNKLAYSAGDSLRVVPSGGGTPVTLTNGYFPAWSPNGEIIAFCRGGGDEARIWIIPHDGGVATQISVGEGIYPSWSPDGTRLAFISDRSGQIDIWIIPIGGGDAERFTTSGDVWWPAWSPNGTWIAYWHDQKLWVKQVESGSRQLVWDSDVFPMGLSWSPDSQNIASTIYGLASSGRYELYVAIVSLSDGELEPFLDGAFWPVWSPDWTRMALFRDCESSDIWVVPVN